LYNIIWKGIGSRLTHARWRN